MDCRQIVGWLDVLLEWWNILKEKEREIFQQTSSVSPKLQNILVQDRFLGDWSFCLQGNPSVSFARRTFTPKVLACTLQGRTLNRKCLSVNTVARDIREMPIWKSTWGLCTKFIKTSSCSKFCLPVVVFEGSITSKNGNIFHSFSTRPHWPDPDRILCSRRDDELPTLRQIDASEQLVEAH